MAKSESELEKTALKFEAKCGRIVTRVLMVLLPLLILDYFSPMFWFHRRSEIERKFPVQIVRQPKPYTMFGGAQNERLTEDIVLNEKGYRGEVPLVPKPSSEFRVFMLGGSTVFHGDPPIADLVEEEFRENGFNNVKMYNYGVVSGVSGMELARIVFEIADLEPDLVIMYNGTNDILSPNRYDPRPGYPFNFIVYENNPLLESDIKSYPTLNLMLYGSNLARTFFPHYFIKRFIPMEAEREKAGWGTDTWRNEIAQTYLRNLVKARKISEAFGAEFIAFFQPMVYYKNSLSPEEKSYHHHLEWNDHCIRVREKILKDVPQLNKGATPLLVDLSDIHDDTEATMFTDMAHTNQESKVVVAKAIFQHLVKNLSFKQK